MIIGRKREGDGRWGRGGGGIVSAGTSASDGR